MFYYTMYRKRWYIFKELKVTLKRNFKRFLSICKIHFFFFWRGGGEKEIKRFTTTKPVIFFNDKHACKNAMETERIRISVFSVYDWSRRGQRDTIQENRKKLWNTTVFGVTRLPLVAANSSPTETSASEFYYSFELTRLHLYSPVPFLTKRFDLVDSPSST